MTPTRSVDRATLLAKRQLRTRIARSRRQIDGTLVALAGERRRLTSWRTYVSQFPVAALALSLSAGVLLSAAGSRRRLWRLVGPSVTNWALSAVREGMWEEVAALWSRVAKQGRHPD